MRSFKIVAATGAAAALMLVGAPAASATEGPGDAGDCTTTFIRNLVVSDDPQLVTVTYTPPTTVTVSADGAVGVATGVANLTVAYVDCVV